MKIIKRLNKTEKLLFILNMMPFMGNVQPLKENELSLMLATQELPNNLMLTPFSSSSRRFYKEKLQMSDQTLSKLIGSLFEKEWLIEEEYGEKIIKEPIRKVIEYINTDEPIIQITIKNKNES